MIILNEDTYASLANITVLLKRSEASQMISYLEELLLNNKQNKHFHLNNENYSKEITLALYDYPEDIEGFAQEIIDHVLSVAG